MDHYVIKSLVKLDSNSPCTQPPENELRTTTRIRVVPTWACRPAALSLIHNCLMSAVKITTPIRRQTVIHTIVITTPSTLLLVVLAFQNS